MQHAFDVFIATFELEKAKATACACWTGVGIALLSPHLITFFNIWLGFIIAM